MNIFFHCLFFLAVFLLPSVVFGAVGTTVTDDTYIRERFFGVGHVASNADYTERGTVQYVGTGFSGHITGMSVNVKTLPQFGFNFRIFLCDSEQNNMAFFADQLNCETEVFPYLKHSNPNLLLDPDDFSTFSFRSYPGGPRLSATDWQHTLIFNDADTYGEYNPVADEDLWLEDRLRCLNFGTRDCSTSSGVEVRAKILFMFNFSAYPITKRWLCSFILMREMIIFLAGV